MLTDKAVHLTSVRVRGSGDPQKNERLIIQKEDLKREKEEAEKEKDRIYDEVGIMICRIPNANAQEVLIRYYLEEKSMQEVAEKMHYCRRQIARFWDTGLEELEKLLAAEAVGDVTSMRSDAPVKTIDAHRFL